MDSKLYPPRMAELEKGYKLVYGKIHEQLKRKWFQYTERDCHINCVMTKKA